MQTTRDRLHVGQTSILVFLKRDHVSSLQLRRIVTPAEVITRLG